MWLILNNYYSFQYLSFSDIPVKYCPAVSHSYQVLNKCTKCAKYSLK